MAIDAIAFAEPSFSAAPFAVDTGISGGQVHNVAGARPGDEIKA